MQILFLKRKPAKILAHPFYFLYIYPFWRIKNAYSLHFRLDKQEMAFSFGH